MQRLIDCVDMVRWILSSAAESSGGVGVSDGFNSLDYTALAMTLTRHVNLTLRMIIMAPQCVHLRGGCFLLLRRILQLENTLCLGRLPLTAGHLYVHSGGDRGNRVDKGTLNKSSRFSMSGKLSLSIRNLDIADTKSETKGVPVSQLTNDLPTPLLDLEEMQELEQDDLEVDSLGKFRRAFAAQKTNTEDADGAFQLLTDISNMSHILLQALATDVHSNVHASIHDLLTYSTSHRILNPERVEEHKGSPDAEEVSPSLPIGVPTVRPTQWKKTKSALLFVARHPNKDKRMYDLEKNQENISPVTSKPVITVKMALQQFEPASNLVFLKKKFRDVQLQVQAVKSLQTFSSGASAAKRQQEKEKILQEKRRQEQEQDGLLFGGGLTGSVDDLNILGADMDLDSGSVVSDITGPDNVDSGDIFSSSRRLDVINENQFRTQSHREEEERQQLQHDLDDDLGDRLMTLPSAVSLSLPEDFNGTL
jgi:hypothetical protein